MQILNAEQMREADRRTIEDVGIPGRVLMETAGRAVVRRMEKRIPNLERRSIAIICGKGNNGGDGLVVFRTLVNLGYQARAWVLSPFESMSANAIDNLQAALKLGLPVESVPSELDWADAVGEVASSDVVVDAILGTGLNETARGLSLRVIDYLNALPAYRVAIDVPSGLSSDTGSLPGVALRADLTVALGAPKVCHFIPPACEHCGEVDIVQIGIPSEFLLGSEPRLETIEPKEMAGLWPPRRLGSHKGVFGHLLVVAGSVGKTGAAVMTARAALRAGAGLVTVASAASAIPMMAPAAPEIMWAPLPETSGGAIASKAAEGLKELLSERSAVAVGPGLGQHPETIAMVRELVKDLDLPMVIDADGLNALGTLEGSLDGVAPNSPLALTPHPGEAGRLLGLSAADVQRDRIQAARSLATRARLHILLKGYRTLVSDPDGNLKVNLTGNPGMATAGTGDVLTGIIGGLLAQGLAMGDALSLAAQLHGLAGDLATEKLGATAVLATDLLDELPAAARQLGAA